MIINIYPSQLKGQPLERHCFDGTLHEWLLQNVPEYKPGDDHPFSVSSGGEKIPAGLWGNQFAEVDIRPMPRELATVLSFVGKVIIAALVSMALNALFGKKPGKPKTIAAGQDLSFSDVRANTAKINQVIPEIAGRHRIYPDYLCQPYKRFSDPRTQVSRFMLSIGKGEFEINTDDLKIGESKFTEIGGITHEIFSPGADVSGNLAHENWYNAQEVGATAGGYGIRLEAGGSGTPRAEATNYQITGASIIVPTGGGAMPQDWEVGNVVSIVAFTKTMTVIDGGMSNRDKVRLEISGLDTAVNSVLTITGAGANDGRYKVVTKSSVSVTGTPSSVEAVKVSPLEFASSPITFYLNAQAVLLDDDYVDFDALVTEIQGQIAGATVSHTGGVVKITDDTPFDGQPLALTGYFDPVFGSSPFYVIGVKTETYDELTLDVWGRSQNFETGEISEGYVPASAMVAGVFTAAEIQNPRYYGSYLETLPDDTTVTRYDYRPTEYRVTAITTGAIPGGTTGTVGFTFQRLAPDGTDDTGWSGFSPETTTPDVELVKIAGVVGGWAGPFAATPKGEVTSVLEVDIFAPNGIIWYSKSGSPRALGVSYEVQWSSDTTAWQSINYGTVQYTADQLGFTHTIALPSAQSGVKVRIRRLTSESSDTRVSNRLEWSGLKAKLQAKTSYAGVTSMAVEIVGSDLVSSQSNNQINLIATRKLNGVAERNIAPWVRYVLGTIGIDSSKIDNDELNRLHDIWSARGDYFDYAQLSQDNARDVLNRALGAGFAEVTIDDGLAKPVRDEARTVFEESYSAQNMTTPLRRSFKSIRPDDFDGVDVVYLDPDTFVEQTIECRLPGDAGYKAELIRAEGVNDPTRAWRIGMRRRREQKYRRWAYEWGTEMDALNSGYLSYCAVVDDVPGYGRSGWIKDAYLDGAACVLQVSEPFEFEAGQSHVVAWRDLDGVLVGPFPVTAGSNGYELVAATTTLPEFDDSAEPPHVYFGTTTRWHHPVLINKVAPDGLASCKVSAFNYDARVYADDDNAPD